MFHPLRTLGAPKAFALVIIIGEPLDVLPRLKAGDSNPL